MMHKATTQVAQPSKSAAIYEQLEPVHRFIVTRPSIQIMSLQRERGQAVKIYTTAPVYKLSPERLNARGLYLPNDKFIDAGYDIRILQWEFLEGNNEDTIFLEGITLDKRDWEGYLYPMSPDKRGIIKFQDEDQ